MFKMYSHCKFVTSHLAMIFSVILIMLEQNGEPEVSFFIRRIPSDVILILFVKNHQLGHYKDNPHSSPYSKKIRFIYYFVREKRFIYYLSHHVHLVSNKTWKWIVMSSIDNGFCLHYCTEVKRNFSFIMY